MTWETIIGLEVHVQLKTRSKMFCGCSASFGDPPNTNVCPTCLALPGALPVPNAEAIRLATLAALALNCTVHERSVFARKNYFYPDLPKGYQISQFDKPLATKGWVEIDTAERGRLRIGVTRLHVEEDSGKSVHDRFPGKTAIDLNRAGVPLAEIVSEPDLRSPAEARAYLVALKQILVFAGVSACSMEEGSLRVDGNLSIHRPGTPFGTKTEVKNLNSFANVERALELELARQTEVLDADGTVDQVTMLYHAGSDSMRVMRSKEESHDYRYFPDPDLPPLVLARTWIEARREELPELPDQKRQRLISSYGIPAYDAGVLIGEPLLADYFEAVVAAGADAKQASNWVMGDVIAAWNDTAALEVSAPRLVALIALLAANTVSHASARKIFAEMRTSGETPEVLAERLGLKQVADTGALEKWVDEVLAANPSEVARYKGGESKLIGFFVGQVMKKSGGKADPKAVQPVLIGKLT
ncbi:MAG TPA: Asp-tRNA(Asn)/Glu-tRNA(Gln) amidotransferase subunit GatB [Gemmatimonadales bacterium]|nr:Asp-tRNA(Asn)/Glu-tRNA(Gln) amidotransferase subunit GatB [Gemmatimonadales bacterium]